MCEIKVDVAEVLETSVVKDTANWISRVIGAPIEDGLGLLFVDALKERRLRNIIRLRVETQQNIIDNPKTIPLSFGYKLLDKATLEENDSLIIKWANLLTNSMDEDYKGEIRKIFIDILDSLEPIDAKVLELLSQNEKPIDPFSLFNKENKKDISISIDSLIYHNLVIEDYDEEVVPIPDSNLGDWDDPREKQVRGNNNGKYYLTDLGESFIQAVNRKL